MRIMRRMRVSFCCIIYKYKIYLYIGTKKKGKMYMEGTVINFRMDDSGI